ncbi:PREDICTED: RNA exonuclease 4-like [Lupinus angustifolius]|uniref:RNA exonuclease 4-like n=1 Tax=Lupinus angustifolius TaxID=3871 RepID=UPI00092F2B21|nr:PREDICTED: RNA exonuclease 4-like [Lupinus angustifolius]
MDTNVDPLQNPAKRHKCCACYKQYKKKEHLIEHMKISYHSIHQPRCPICLKHCKFLESIREHILGPSCSDIFSEQGCQLCLKIFGSSGSRNEHMEFCRLPAPIPLGTTASPTIVPDFDCQDSCDENHVGMRPRAIAIDCEMVGGGSDGSLELCARVCLVDEDEKVIFHTYVQPQMPVTNYRYEITGLTEEHLRDAMPLKQVQQKILQILHNGESIGKVRLESSDGGKARLLVGHGLAHDLDCLKLSYPNHLLRDTSLYPPLLKTNSVSQSLKYLTRTYLGYDIQTGTHDPYEDCVSVMRLYKRIRGQVHQDEGNRTSTSTASNNIIPESDPWGSKEVDNLTPDELYAMSNSNFKCWCLDLKPRSS